MKPKNGFALAILASLAIVPMSGGASLASSIELVKTENMGAQQANILQAHLTVEAKHLIEDMCGDADTKQGCVTLSPSDPRWNESGLDNLSDVDRLLFSLVYEKFGRTMSFTEEGLVVGYKLKKHVPQAVA